MPLPVALFAALLAFIVVGLGCLLALGRCWSAAAPLRRWLAAGNPARYVLVWSSQCADTPEGKRWRGRYLSAAS